ncbi:AAA family ATPase [Kaustia mangrovi]|uniref:AAA family ATPase n=1 Tax=Kaustia mangrovi TaxID=2593653 RepID=A0A7S8HCL4_9HYPH|nr:AAA family ATPase [Kaustia mangrovi]QPC43378.1 AAA family ATPase [Kaustia mangrovi]
MMIVFAGLPGTGKSTIAARLAEYIGAVYLRIDSIEAAIRTAGGLAPRASIGPEGYLVAYRLAADNLALGLTVIADSVNPIALTRDAYRAVAREQGVSLLEVEVVCSDEAEHRRRFDTRRASRPQSPSWADVRSREYETWDRPRLVIDTAERPVADSVGAIVDALRQADIQHGSPPRT